MEAAWALIFHDLHPDTQQVVRACAVLDQPSIALVTAAAVAATPVSRVTQLLAVAAEAGWGSVTDDRFDLAVDTRPYLVELAASMSTGEAQLVLGRVAAAVTAMAEQATAMSPDVRTDVLSVVRSGIRYGQPGLAAQVARAAWRSAASASPVDWRGKLAALGEEAAIAAQQPNLLVDLLDSSATAYSSTGDWQGAERAWLRALAIVDRLRDAARTWRFLHLLATNYRNWGRLHKTADTLLEVVALCEREGDPVKTAEALAAVGTTMLDAGRHDPAVEYLTRAHRLLRELPGGRPDARARHAIVLADLGRVHTHRGALNTARTCYHEALALALDVDDDEVAAWIRELQAALPSASP